MSEESRFYQQVVPVVDWSVRSLCCRPYPNHKHGCPNHGKKERCPPTALTISKIINLDGPVYAIYNKFNFEDHTSRMRSLHPFWSDRQVECCLYWQGTARKQLKHKIELFLKYRLVGSPIIVDTPEACGVNITATMKSIGIELEWPPKHWAYQVVLVGTKPPADERSD